MPAHQLVPTAPEFYVGAGGAYNLGLERVVSGGGITGIFSNTFFSAEFDRRQTGGFGAIGYAGARMSFGGAWFGVEGEYMRRGGHAKTETGTPGGNIAGTVVGASTTIIESRLSDRVSASALVGVPVFGPLSLYGRAGLSWATLRESATQTYAGAVNGTTCSFVFPVGCTTAFQFSDPLIWRRSRDLVSPVVAAGVEVPLGSFFARFETEAEFLSLPNNAIVTPVVLRSTPPGAFFSGSTTAQASFTAPFGQNKDSDIAWRMSASVGARF
jgi:opacity protein-like surface antigen